MGAASAATTRVAGVANTTRHGRAYDPRGTGPGQGRRAVLRQPDRRLTLLAPEIVEAILDGRQPAEPQLDDMPERSPAGRDSARL